MKAKDKALQVSAIKDGTVIDHIPSESLFKVITILNLSDYPDMVTFGSGFDSKVLGKKAIIKIQNKYFADEEVNKIALIAPTAKLNTIKNYEVSAKRSVEIPDEITSIAKCFNPKCITNHEPMTTRFVVVNKYPVELKCKYCEKITSEEDIIIL